MKHTILNIALALTLLIPTICGGCADEIFPREDEGTGNFVLSVALSSEGKSSDATRAPFDIFDNEDDKWGVAGENIESLRIIIVAADGTVEHNSLFNATNATYLGKYTFKVKDNEEKIIVLVANEENYSTDVEGMEISGGIQSLSHFLEYSFMPGALFDEEKFNNLTIALSHNSLDDKKMSFATPLPITAIYHETIPDLEQGSTLEKEYLLHRAAVKYSFRIVNESKYAHTLHSVSINGITDREFLFPHAVYGTRNEVISYETPSTASRGNYTTTLSTPLSLPAQMQQAVVAIPSFYVPEGIPSETSQKVSIALDGIQLAEWKNLDWRMPGETETTASPMVDLPRNTHVVVNITITDTGIRLIADVQPYAEQEVDTWLGLDRDPDGNIITSRHPEDDTYEVIIDGKTVRKDLDGDEVIKDFSDGSLFCKTIILKDYIHDGNEVDYEYPYEKDFSGGNMIIIRELSSGGTYHGSGDDEAHHDHDNTDRALFVLGDDNEFYRCDWSKTDEKGHPTLSRFDADGAKIIQCNGYQFRMTDTGTHDENILAMQKYIGTYLVECNGVEELRYYRETYTAEHKGLVLDIELGLNDPDFKSRYPNVRIESPPSNTRSFSHSHTRADALRFIKAAGRNRIAFLNRYFNRK